MTFRVYNHKTFYENQNDLSIDPKTGFIIFKTDDENLIRDLININQQQSIGLRIYNTDIPYSTVIIENPHELWTQLGQDITGLNPIQLFGDAVCINNDGTRIVIGSPYTTVSGVGSSGTDVGQVSVYELNGSTWTKIGQDIDGTSENGEFGYSVAISGGSGNTIIAGLPGQGNGKGNVKIYDWNGSSWVQRSNPPLSASTSGARYGSAVSISDNGIRVAIGSPDNVGSLGKIGMVEFYDWTASTDQWAVRGAAPLTGIGGDAKFGTSISFNSDGSMVAIGAPDSSGATAGETKIYEWDASTSSLWQLMGIAIKGETIGDQSGTSVSLNSDGSIVAIGSPRNDGGGVGVDAGQARVYYFDTNTSSWIQLGEDFHGVSAGDKNGIYVSLSSDVVRIAIGAPYSNKGENDGGITTFYDLEEGTLGPSSTWKQVGEISGKEGDESGSCLFLSSSGSRVVISSDTATVDGIGEDVGMVRVYEYNEM